MNNSDRFIELDLWRGLAILGMIVFHFVFILNFFGIVTIRYFEGGWLVFSRIVQWSFLLLVGIGIRLSYQKTLERGFDKYAFLLKNLKRGALVFACGMIVTLMTWLVIPEAFVRFGILHLIGVSIIVLGFVADRPTAALILSGVLYGIGLWLQGQETSYDWLSLLGFSIPKLQMLDFFPIFPWMAIPSLGIFLGNLVYGKSSRPMVHPELGETLLGAALVWCGRHSLLIYMVHAPILVGSVLLLHTVL